MTAFRTQNRVRTSEVENLRRFTPLEQAAPLPWKAARGVGQDVEALQDAQLNRGLRPRFDCNWPNGRAPIRQNQRVCAAAATNLG